jgi:hypothetical protein
MRLPTAATKGETLAEVAKSRLSRPPRQRAVALAVASAGTLFWLYTFYGIARVPSGDGSGFQWIAVMPLGLIFLVLTLPALILALIDRLLWLSLMTQSDIVGQHQLLRASCDTPKTADGSRLSHKNGRRRVSYALFRDVPGL